MSNSNSSYRIKPVKIGVKTRFRIQKRVLFFLWQTVVNPVIHPVSPYEYKLRSDAEKQMAKLESSK